ncbi:glycosyltransferase [Pseudomonas sp. Fl5BN2]|nr:glycosyltransferase [Pseudomonas sp. Fl5BN2]NBF03290.1 glycosyltransferase [Pseudomonas sp. Fl5BN2]
MYAPVVIFVYDRLDHLRQTINALKLNILARETDIFIYSDAAKTPENEKAISEVRSYLSSISGFHSVSIIHRESNFGLAKSIISGITETLESHDRIIVMEDDLVTSPYFLSYMNDGLDMYQDHPEVASIHGYIYPIEHHGLPDYFFLKGADCWGWATWRRAWQHFVADGRSLLEQIQKAPDRDDFDFSGGYKYTKMLQDQVAGRNNSWAIRWYASAFLRGMVTLYPSRSFVHNIGNDGSGTHSEITDHFDSNISTTYPKLSLIKTEDHASARARIIKYFNSTKPNLIRRVIRAIKRRLS